MPWQSSLTTQGQRRTKDLSLELYPKIRKVVYSTPHFFFDYKNIALFVLSAVLPCQTICISHKHPLLINSLFAIFMLKRTWASESSDTRWAVSIKRQWLWPKHCNRRPSTAELNLKKPTTVRSSPLLTQEWWIQVPIWVLAGSKSHQRRSGVSAGWGAKTVSLFCLY